MIGHLKAKFESDLHLVELLKGGGTALVFRTLGVLAGYLFVFLVSRLFGEFAMGAYSLSYTVLMILSVLCRLGTDTSIIRYVAESAALNRPGGMRHVYTSILRVIGPVGLAVTALTLAGASMLAADVFREPNLTGFIRIAAWGILPLSLFHFHAECLRGLKKIALYSFFKNLSLPLGASLILMGLAAVRSGPKSPILAYVGASAFLFVLVAGFWLAGSKIFRHPAEVSVSVGSIISTSLPMFLSGSLFLVMRWIDTLMLGMFRSVEEVGIYYVAVRIANVTAITLFAINTIAAPKFAEFFARNDIEGLGRMARQSTRIIFWLSFPVLIFILAFPSWVLGIFGPGYRTGSTALILLILGQFINAVSGSVGYILNMTGNQTSFRNIVLTATAVNVGLNFLLIPRLGIVGAGIASLVCLLTWNIASVISVRKRFGFLTMYLPLLPKGWI